MRIYIDGNCKCHTANPDGTLREFDVPFFDGKCPTFIEGYRFVPEGESWTRSDGVAFQGEMIAPCKDYSELDAIQREYEKQTLAEYETLINDLYSEVTT